MTFNFLVPRAIGRKQHATTVSKGVGEERMIAAAVRKAKREIDNMDTVKDDNSRVLTSIAKENAEKFIRSQAKISQLESELRIVKKKLDENHFSNHLEKIRKNLPVFSFHSLKNNEVKQRTGIKTKGMMMANVTVFCNGDLEKLTSTVSKLTWLEEWMVYFEVQWGKTHTRWSDISSTYGVSRQVVRNVVDDKCALINCCRESWPVFALYKEDESLRHPKWNGKYQGKRLIM